ncbi:MAG: 50S ribosomal protein L15 [Desulfobacteraceae bacterium]
MKLYELAPAPGSGKSRKRVGRGPGSGMGKTSCRGHKGLKARSGGSVRPGFEGGQMPIYRRLPKRGFKSLSSVNRAVVNVGDLDRFEDGSVIDIAALKTAGLAKNKIEAIKVLGTGEVNKVFSMKECSVSSAAREKIESAGGKIEL